MARLFYNARMDDSTLGRFTSADTIIPGGVQGLDRYAYGLNNPSRYTDPTGHMVEDESDGAGCSGGGPACIMDMWSGYDDADHMMAALRNWVRYHKDYDLQADSRLGDEGKAIVAIAAFQVAVEDRKPAAEVAAAGGLLSFFAIIVNGVNMSPDDSAGGGGGSALSGPKWTSKMLSESEVIAQGYNIRDVKRLVQTYGGNPKGWKKNEGVGREWPRMALVLPSRCWKS
jgi:hypothetical protein